MKASKRTFLIVLCVLGFAGIIALFTQRAAPPEFGPVTYSSDGKYVVFSYGKGQTCFLYRALLQTGEAARLTTAKDGCEADPAYSPDGKLIAYSFKLREQRKASIYLVGADGSDAHLLVPGDGDDAFPVFSPQGDRIFFLRSRFFGNYDGMNSDRRHEIDAAHLAGNVFVCRLAKPMEARHHRIF